VSNQTVKATRNALAGKANINTALLLQGTFPQNKSRDFYKYVDITSAIT